MMNSDSQLRAAFNANIDWRSLLYEPDFNVNATDSSTDTQPTSADSVDLMERNKPAAIALLIGLIIFGVFLVYNFRRKNSETDEEGEASLEEEEGISPLASKIFKMSPEERMGLYSDVFDSNKHQIVLEASSIIVSSKGDVHSISTSDTEEEESSEFGQDEDPSIYLALQNVQAMRRSTILESSIKLVVPSGVDDESNANLTADISNNFSRKRRASSLVHPRNSILDAENGISKAGSFEEKNLVRGNCVICFEDMQAGETVVWSENKCCPHVYHKDCMVAYLAHKKQSIEEIEKDENPCPTCRQKFVTVCTLAK